MPKTVSGLWDEVVSFENIYCAYIRARTGKRFNNEVMQYTAKAEENVVNLQNHLIWKTWRPSAPKIFPSRGHKRRYIHAPTFSDRVLHHALIGVVEPHFEKKYIYDSYACRKGKGTQAAVKRVQHFIRLARRRWGDGCYVIQADIAKYFASINHNILMKEVARTISDPDVLDLWWKICRGHEEVEDGVGVGVGALTSQVDANVHLNPLDHAAKDDLGLKYYVRYMDDFIVIVKDKGTARRALCELERVVRRLGLELNPKTAYHPWQRGVDFCGYRIWPTHLLPRKRNIKQARKDFKKLAIKYRAGLVDIYHVRDRVMSFLAYAKHCDAQRTIEGVLGDLVLVSPSGYIDVNIGAAGE